MLQANQRRIQSTGALVYSAISFLRWAPRSVLQGILSSHEYSTFWNEHSAWEEAQSQSCLRHGTVITWTGCL
ncbi:hypothetical protein Pyn_12277 [Prunus yedoensis var. nudiflora]|uniref:Uncharacterized protein n=1 Tax=Prunus yedoensis var. nudiflora TaxID=2094558 RepID=A0A314UWB0_PRUYE|nr:hypothetical protein Pyn_12277 [Prunus yedoensis var. nudiflora]